MVLKHGPPSFCHHHQSLVRDGARMLFGVDHKVPYRIGYIWAFWKLGSASLTQWRVRGNWKWELDNDCLGS